MSRKKLLRDNAFAIGQRMKEIRNDLGLTQSDFARSLGLSQNFISGVESGNKSLSEPIVLLVRYRYGINDDWIIAGTEPKKLKGEGKLPCMIQLNEKSPMYQLYRQLERIYNEGDRTKIDAVRAQLKAFDPGEKKQDRDSNEDAGTGTASAG